MSEPHPNDKVAALQEAVNRAREDKSGDPLQALNLATLTWMLDQARQEARA